jgi:hypothetical protein
VAIRWVLSARAQRRLRTPRFALDRPEARGPVLYYIRRWSMESTFQEARLYLGPTAKPARQSARRGDVPSKRNNADRCGRQDVATGRPQNCNPAIKHENDFLKTLEGSIAILRFLQRVGNELP